MNRHTEHWAPLPAMSAGGDGRTHVIFLPAMGVEVGFYAPFLERLRAAADVATTALELPGQGAHPMRARRGDDFGYRDIVEDILPRTVQAIAREHPATRIVVLGHSLGGQMAVLACGEIAQQIDRLVLVAAGTAHWRDWPAPYRLRAAVTVHAIAAAAAVLPWYPGRRLGFGGDQARRMMRDWSHNARTGRYRLEGSRRSAQDLQAQLASVRLAVDVVAIDGDPVAPPSASAALLAHLPQATVRVRQVRGVERDAPWRRHFSWARRASDVDDAVLAALAGAAANEPMVATGRIERAA